MKMEEYPPVDFLAAAFLAKNKPKPLAEQIGSLGFPRKRGKVKRGDISR